MAIRSKSASAAHHTKLAEPVNDGTSPGWTRRFAPKSSPLPASSMTRRAVFAGKLVRFASWGRFASLGRFVSLGCLTVVLTGSTGCTMFNASRDSLMHLECIDEFMVEHRNRVMAAKAWYREKVRLAGHHHAKDLKAGFIKGYLEVAEGGPGCTPAVAPQDYWGWRYQSASGRVAVNSWFEGYPLGVKAAEQDGIGHWSHVSLGSHHVQTTVKPTPASTPAAYGPAGAEAIAPSPFLQEGEVQTGPVEVQDSLLGNPAGGPEVQPLPAPADEATGALGDFSFITPTFGGLPAALPAMDESAPEEVELIPQSRVSATIDDTHAALATQLNAAAEQRTGAELNAASVISPAETSSSGADIRAAFGTSAPATSTPAAPPKPKTMPVSSQTDGTSATIPFTFE